MLGLSFLNSTSGDGVEEERRVKGEVWPVVWPDEMHPCPWWASCLRRQARERVGVANAGIACLLVLWLLVFLKWNVWLDGGLGESCCLGQRTLLAGSLKQPWYRCFPGLAAG